MLFRSGGVSGLVCYYNDLGVAKSPLTPLGLECGLGKLMNKIWSDFCWGGYLLERGGGWSCAFRPMLERGVLTDLTQIFQN